MLLRFYRVNFNYVIYRLESFILTFQLLNYFKSIIQSCLVKIKEHKLHKHVIVKVKIKV